MTHTLEVAQIARIISRALMLNEDLVEAAALGHDLGHTPFGHAGERAMQKCYDSSFAHYKQSLRVVDLLENEGRGLNLTYEVRDAILNHQGENRASTLEGLVVKFADRIAYINHDIDDAIHAGVLKQEDIPSDILEILGHGHSERINKMVSAVVEASTGINDIRMTPDVGEATEALRTYLFDHVYTHPAAKADEQKAVEMLTILFEYFCKHPDQMPRLYISAIERDGLERCVCDFVSSMTDRYAIDTFCDLFVPSGWKGNKQQ